MLSRHLLPELLAALESPPVVYLQGPRQCGKSTLVRQMAESSRPARYLSLDDISLLSAARKDPQGFIAGIDGPCVIDEVQLCPELLLPIKAAVDRRRVPGRFLLTGSANALVVPEIARSLVGRMEMLTLLPFSQGEIAEQRESFVDALFGDKPAFRASEQHLGDLGKRVTTGGYPEVVHMKDVGRRRAWFDSYVATLLQRDVRDLAHVEDLSRLPDLLRLLAARAGSILNFAELSRSTQTPQTTLKRYFALLEAVFLVQRLPAWSTNMGKRLVTTPKLHFVDTGLAARLLDVDAERWKEEPHVRGALSENFVLSELNKQISWSKTRPRIYHFRAHAGDEIDFILEGPRGRIVGIEVKSGATLDAKDFAPLKRFAEHLGKRFVRGVVLYAGSEVVPVAANIHGVPIASLWTK